jgi:lysophospholipase L1-like esterase
MASIPLIICFGDSLTAGYQADGFAVRQTPYGEFLQERLGGVARVITSGVCGETTSEMVHRFRRDVVVHHPAWVCILGGTNDLGCNEKPETVMRNLVDLYQQARAADITPVALTIPSIRIEATTSQERAWRDDHIGRRRTLNGLIADYAARNSMPCLDLFTATAERDTGMLAARYSNDGLHLTTAGYQLMAAQLYEAIFKPGLQSPV